MRLINTTTMEMRETGCEDSSYVILSHRWRTGSDGEATLQDLRTYLSNASARGSTGYQTWIQEHFKGWRSILSGSRAAETRGQLFDPNSPPAFDTGRDSLDDSAWSTRQETNRADHQVEAPIADVSDASFGQSAGLRKVRKFCNAARAHGYQWAWMDTVCIDKTNHAELSEAINSMFRWYESAECCFVYLQDIDARRKTFDIGHSSWFERGWTLQELVAPSDMVFFDEHWNKLGTKLSLGDELSAASGVPLNVLQSPTLLHRHNNAQRLSWAAARVTTREEDQTYCLLGLLGINMPLIYGEGGVQAFQRMQTLLMERYDDESLLAWEMTKDDGSSTHVSTVTVRLPGCAERFRGTGTGILAQSVGQFANCANIHLDHAWTPRTPNRMSNRGLEVCRRTEVPFCEDAACEQHALEVDETETSDVRSIPIACSHSQTSRACRILVALDRTAKAESLNRWRRIMFSEAEARRFDKCLSRMQLKAQVEHLVLCLHPAEVQVRSRQGQPSAGIRDVREINAIMIKT